MAEVRILIADDHTLFRQGIRQMCEMVGGYQVIAEAENGEEAIEKALSLRPDVVLMDIHMPGINGVEATRQICSRNPAIRVLILTGYPQEDIVLDAITAGASGFVLKDAEWNDLMTAIRQVSEGQGWIVPAVASRLLDEYRRLTRPSAQPSPAPTLTQPEMDVLVLVAHGLENDEIAQRLQVTEKTITNRLSKIYRKLGVKTRTQAALFALRLGWASLEDFQK